MMKNSEHIKLDSVGADIDEKIHYTNHIIDTHFETFHWLDVKMQSMLVVATAALAASVIVFKDIKEISQLVVYMNVASSIFLMAGITISLIHLIPTLDSKVGNIQSKNPRVAASIKLMSKEEYYGRISNIKKSEMLLYNCNQISGLALICNKGQGSLRNVVVCLILGLTLILFSLIFHAVVLDNKETDLVNGAESTTINPKPINNKVERIETNQSDFSNKVKPLDTVETPKDKKEETP